MDDSLQDLKEALATAQAELEEARARAEDAASALQTASDAYDLAPIDARYAALEAAKKTSERAARDVEARERRAREREMALNAATREEDRAELERLQVQLRDRARGYAPILAQLAELDRMLEETIVKPLEALNAEHVRTWERAQDLARRLGDFAFTSRCPRPKNNEVLVLSRVAVAQAREAEGRRLSLAHKFIDPLTRPAWNDTATVTYEGAVRLLQTAKEACT